MERSGPLPRLSQQQLVAYLTSDGAGLVGPDAGGAAAARALNQLHEAMARSNIDTKSFQLLNLCSDWLRVFLPHVLQKIDRVSFGLLSVAYPNPNPNPNPGPSPNPNPNPSPNQVRRETLTLTLTLTLTRCAARP